MTVSQTIRGQYNCLELSGVHYAGRYEKEMLLQNEYTYLPRRIIGTVNNEEIISYQIDGYKSLSEKWNRTSPNLMDVKKLINDLIKCIEELDDHLLSADKIMLDDRYIFYDTARSTYRFLYAPSEENDFASEIKKLFERIMLVFDHGNKEEVGELYDMYSLLLADNMSVGMFCENILKLEDMGECGNVDTKAEVENIYETYTDVNVGQELPEVNIKYDGYTERTKETSEFLDLKCKLIIMVYVLASCVAYVLFGQLMIRFIAIALVAVSIYVGWDVYERRISKKKKEGYELVPSSKFRGSENIVIDEGITTIGRRAENCDYCISEEEISRVHAVIEKHGDQLTVTDKGSKNGTYINNIPVIQDQPHKLNYGDKLRLATLEYVVCQKSNGKRG